MPITTHAAQRVRERVQRGAGKELALLDSLWAMSRPAHEVDFRRFQLERRSHYFYRVALWEGRLYLIIRATSGEYITVWESKAR